MSYIEFFYLAKVGGFPTYLRRYEKVPRSLKLSEGPIVEPVSYTYASERKNALHQWPGRTRFAENRELYNAGT